MTPNQTFILAALLVSIPVSIFPAFFIGMFYDMALPYNGGLTKRAMGVIWGIAYLATVAFIFGIRLFEIFNKINS
jgi:hypothetical protein